MLHPVGICPLQIEEAALQHIQGHGIDADLGQAHESALKEAETDAMQPQAREAVAGPDDLWQPVRIGFG